MASTVTPGPDSDQVTISTASLLLRGAQPGDETDMFAAFSNAEVMRYWSTVPHQEIDQTRMWIEKMTNSPQNGVTDFIICLQPSSTPIGKIGIWSGHEIGFMLARQYWGRGLATEALRAVLPYFFSGKFEFSQIIADVDPRNAGSIGILQKHGFLEYDFKEKTAEIGGEWVDSTYLKLTRETWESLEAGH